MSKLLPKSENKSEHPSDLSTPEVIHVRSCNSATANRPPKLNVNGDPYLISYTFTVEEDELLFALRAQGKSYKEIRWRMMDKSAKILKHRYNGFLKRGKLPSVREYVRVLNEESKRRYEAEMERKRQEAWDKLSDEEKKEFRRLEEEYGMDQERLRREQEQMERQEVLDHFRRERDQHRDSQLETVRMEREEKERAEREAKVKEWEEYQMAMKQKEEERLQHQQREFLDSVGMSSIEEWYLSLPDASEDEDGDVDMVEGAT